MNLRIVKCSRGELVTGFRVQRETYLKRFSESGETYAPGWVNTGRKFISTEQAREYRDFVLKYQRQYEKETVEVIPEDTPAVNAWEYQEARAVKARKAPPLPPTA